MDLRCEILNGYKKQQYFSSLLGGVHFSPCIAGWMKILSLPQNISYLFGVYVEMFRTPEL